MYTVPVGHGEGSLKQGGSGEEGRGEPRPSRLLRFVCMYAYIILATVRRGASHAFYVQLSSPTEQKGIGGTWSQHAGHSGGGLG